MYVEFLWIEKGEFVLICIVVFNWSGWIDVLLLIGDMYVVGDYELLMCVDDYFWMKGVWLLLLVFLFEVLICFCIIDVLVWLYLFVQFGLWNYMYYCGS